MSDDGVPLRKEHLRPVLLQSCPSFRPEDPEQPTYILLGEFAEHLLERQRAGATEELLAAVRLIERLHVEGDAYVREATTIGILEAILNISGWSGLDAEAFGQYLLPVSRRWWDSLHAFWSGKIAHIGAGL